MDDRHDSVQPDHARLPLEGVADAPQLGEGQSFPAFGRECGTLQEFSRRPKAPHELPRDRGRQRVEGVDLDLPRSRIEGLEQLRKNCSACGDG